MDHPLVPMTLSGCGSRSFHLTCRHINLGEGEHGHKLNTELSERKHCLQGHTQTHSGLNGL